jgi:hypothetical protein
LADDSNQFPGQHVWYVLQLAKGYFEIGSPDRARHWLRRLIAAIGRREEFWLLPEIARLYGEMSHDADVGFLELAALAKKQRTLISTLGFDGWADRSRTWDRGDKEQRLTKNAFGRRDGVSPDEDTWLSALFAIDQQALTE